MATPQQLLDEYRQQDFALRPLYEFAFLASLGRHEEALAILREKPVLYFTINRSGPHQDVAFPLMLKHPAYLEVIRPRDGPAEWDAARQHTPRVFQ
ncbi:hypothetical protein BH23GEM3_BH23GEM3_00440 [soil metagenome]